ncbi:aromatic acid exporter family protein [Micromonospora sp. NPDC051227]|uniref:aromatic acid exporter family protein n=1 Tax=Micromonospora sp. NPDC051227 TaxID=3364285 RepID=UPI0037873113
MVLTRYLGRTATGAGRWGGRTARLRLRQLEIITMIAVQAGVAAGLSWWIAHNLLGNPNPVFAPSAAVGTIAAALGQRTRRTVELLLGIGLGILVGDTLVYFIGSGAWQTGVIVTLAIGIALGLVGRGGTVVSQVGGTAVLIATLSSSERNLEIPRVVDAVVGSLVGLVVVAILLPLHPIRIINRAAGPVFRTLAGQLRCLEQALRLKDNQKAVAAMEALRSLGPDVERMQDATKGAEEVVTIAPARWSRRQEFERYDWGVRHLVRVIDDSQDLARRAATALEYREHLPEHLPRAVAALADAVDQLHRDVRHSARSHQQTRRFALYAAVQAERGRIFGLETFGAAVATQVRVAASDMLRTTGCSVDDANRRVRLATHLPSCPERRVERRQEDGVRRGRGD